MARNWLTIAKAEFYVLSVGMRPHRKLYTAILYVLGLVWAVYGAPLIMVGFITTIIPMSQIQTMLMVIFPGLMRSLMMFVWLILILFPMAKALEEIKIGHWEIYLSNNVKTRDILAGGFLGLAPLYGLITLLLAPIVLSPFMAVYEVSIIGQILVYGILALSAITALWLSTFISSVIQSRLGESSRGNDIAKALSIFVAVVAIVPMYAIMFAMETVSQVLGMNAFLLFPFTWSADVVSWLTISFNGIGLTGSQILGFSSTLSLDLLTSVVLMGGFALLVFAGSLVAADRIFTISAGARTERVTTITKENVFVRNVRKIGSGPFGVLMATNMKDYFRKAQNLSKLFYGLVLAVIMPVMITMFTDMGDSILMMELVGIFGMMFALVGGFPHAGIAFLESRDQLWILQSTPHGASKFVKSRIAMATITNVFVTMIPTAVMAFLFGLVFTEIVFLYFFGLIVVIGSSMVAIGVTARNPDYEDTKSPAHQANVMMAMMIPMFAMMASLISLIILTVTDMDFILEAILGVIGFEMFFTFIGPSVLLIIGSVLLVSGIKSLSSPE
ncbi:MAG: hypothetical protein KAR33_13235 [Candidatus Thorarchaeota archaeon]|nr:hypothetical protein [Candidatus Thorarchaeota archaeon]